MQGSVLVEAKQEAKMDQETNKSRSVPWMRRFGPVLYSSRFRLSRLPRAKSELRSPSVLGLAPNLAFQYIAQKGLQANTV